jgi:hypothetical protein
MSDLTRILNTSNRLYRNTFLCCFSNFFCVLHFCFFCMQFRFFSVIFSPRFLVCVSIQAFTTAKQNHITNHDKSSLVHKLERNCASLEKSCAEDYNKNFHVIDINLDINHRWRLTYERVIKHTKVLEEYKKKL